MAIMSDPQRAAGVAEFMRDLSISRVSTGTCNKSDLRAAYNALDQFFSDNASTINQAIPAGPRASLSTEVKARLAIEVIRRRWLNGA